MQTTSMTDPVCGMQVDPAHVAGTRDAAGRTFSFCSDACLAKFDRDPDAYAGPALAVVPPAGAGV